MNPDDLKNIRAFANIRADSGHDEFYVYKSGNTFKFGKAPRTAKELASLILVGNQENN